MKKNSRCSDHGCFPVWFPCHRFINITGCLLCIFLNGLENCIAGYQHRHHLQIPERTSRSPSYPLLRSPSTNRFSSSRYQIRSSDSEPTISLCRMQSSKGRNIFKDIFWNNFQILQTSLVLNQTIFTEFPQHCPDHSQRRWGVSEVYDQWSSISSLTGILPAGPLARILHTSTKSSLESILSSSCLLPWKLLRATS